ncbi:MAG: MarR family transcriptional regulator [Synergistales bacterium]
MEKFTKELDEAVDALLEVGRQVMKNPHDYGNCGVMLYMREIHLIEAIENHPDFNLTQLAELSGFTKGTVSKMISKLEKLSFIGRHQNSDNRKEVFFRLTPLGRRAFEGHYEFHEKKSAGTHKKYQEYTEREKKFILDFVRMYREYLQDYVSP